MLLRYCALVFAGIAAGGVIAAGVFAFLAMIGIFPRMLSAAGAGKRAAFLENFLILGGIWGNVMDLWHPHVPIGGNLLLAAYGFFMGIFVGSLVMSLAETLKAIPVLNRRIRLRTGLPYVITAIALGKSFGAWMYFWKM